MGRKQPTKKKSSELTTWLVGIGAVAIFGGVVAGGIYLSSSGSSGPQTSAPPKRTNCSGSPVIKTDIPDVVQTLCEGQQHVDDGVKVTYHTDPPTSGNHWAGATPPGFYAPGQNEAYWLPERLVHALEHGNVVVYYDPAVITADQQERLKALARKWPGSWDGVVVVPRTDSANPLIATAWEYTLKLKGWDENRINDFVKEFAGRGPENPMR